MALSLKESRACTEMATLLYGFLPGSGSAAWKGHVSFRTVAEKVGVGGFWRGGSKEPAIAALLEQTLEHRRGSFEPLILEIVKEGLKYRQKQNEPVRDDEITKLNGLILDMGFKFPALWDPQFLSSLRTDGGTRASDLVERELQAESLKAAEFTEAQKKLDALKQLFYTLAGQEDRQDAGLALEKLLNALFNLAGLTPREPFRVVGEQIDGSFELDNEVYLLEAKWESKRLPEAPLMVFREKVQGKSSITRGLFIALNGCTTAAIDAITRGKQPNFFLMDGYDLAAILEGNLDLLDVLRAKIRRLAEEGTVMYSAKLLMQA